VLTRRYKFLKPLGEIEFFPLRKTFRHYSWHRFANDIQAAANVCLLDFPQSMAYALIAGLPMQCGIYASIISALVSPFFSASHFAMFGPTTATSVLLLSTFSALDVPTEGTTVILPLLVVMVGLLILVGTFLGVGGLTRYISRGVTTAYVSAAACLIIIKQVGNILGCNLPHSSTFLGSFINILHNLPNIHFPTLIISILTALTYYAVRKCYPKAPHVGVTLLIIALISLLFRFFGHIEIHTALAADLGKWEWSLPVWNFEWIRMLGEPAFAIAFLAIVESCNISKHLAAQSGEGPTKLNQQLLSLGVVNVVSGLGCGMVVSGSMLRSQVNLESGAQTPLTSILSGCFLLVGIFLLGPYFCYIPLCALAVLVTVVAVGLIRPSQIKLITSTTPADALVFIATFLSGLLFQIESAIFIGAGLSIILFLRKVSVPQLIEYTFDEQGAPIEKQKQLLKNTPEISMVQVEGDLFFGSTDIFLDQCRLIVQDPNLKVIILRVRNVHNWDATSVMALRELITFARKANREVIIAGALPELETVLRKAGILEFLGEENFFLHTPGNSHLSTRHALMRAQSLIGKQVTPIIKLFVSSEPTTATVDNGEEAQRSDSAEVPKE